MHRRYRCHSVQPLESRRLLAAQAPYLGQPFAVNDTAPVTIQAEHYDLGGQGTAYHDTTSANIGGAARTGEAVDLKRIANTSSGLRVSDAIAGEWLEYTLDVETAGQYTIDFRVGNRDPGSKFHADLQGVGNITGAMSVPDTNSFDSFATVSKTVTLPGGAQVLRFVFDSPGSSGYGAALDWIKISAAEEPPPPAGQAPFNGVPFAVGSAPVTIQAEDFDTGGEGVAYHDTSGKNIGGKYRTGEAVDIKTISGTSNQYRISDAISGEWMEYTLDVETAGPYVIDFRVGNRDPGSTFHADLQGVGNVTGAMNVPDTNSFDSFATISKTVTLPAGEQIVRFVFDSPGTSGYGAALDWMKLSPAAGEPPPRTPATYYVSSSGSDAGDGKSPATAWQSTAKINATEFIPGDTILFAGGQTFTGGIRFDASDAGTDAAGNLIAPVTVGSYGAGRATIDGGTDAGLYAYRTGGFTVKDLNFVGSGSSTNTRHGIGFYNDADGNIRHQHLVIQNVSATGFGQAGVSVGGYSGASGYRDVVVTDSIFHDNRDGMLSFGPAFDGGSPTYAHRNVRVTRVQAYDNDGDASSSNPTGNGIVLGGVDGGRIEDSTAHHNGSANTSDTGPVGIWAYDSNQITIEHNVSYSNSNGTGGDGDGFDLDQNVSNSVLQYNYSRDNAGAGFLIYSAAGNTRHRNNVVRYNVSLDDSRERDHGGILVNGDVSDLDVYNNTVIFGDGAESEATAAMKVGRIGSDITVRNNIFTAGGNARVLLVTTGGTGLVFQRNNYFSSDSNLSMTWLGQDHATLRSWLDAASDQERLDLDGDGTSDRVALSVDPAFIGAGSVYELTESSPMRDAALDLEARYGINPGAVDINGTSLSQNGGFDIGADEWQA